MHNLHHRNEGLFSAMHVLETKNMSKKQQRKNQEKFFFFFGFMRNFNVMASFSLLSKSGFQWATVKGKKKPFLIFLQPTRTDIQVSHTPASNWCLANFCCYISKQKKRKKNRNSKLYLECSVRTLEAKLPLSALGRRVKWQRSEVHLPLKEKRWRSQPGWEAHNTMIAPKPQSPKPIIWTKRA